VQQNRRYSKVSKARVKDMVKVFSVILLFFLAGQASCAGMLPSVKYTFRGGYPIKVSVSFKAKDKKKTDLLWGFVSYDYAEDLSGDLKNLRRSLAINSSNAVVAKKYLFWDDYGTMKFGSFLIHSMKINHSPVSDISLTYDVANINYFRSEKGSQYLPSLMLPEVMKKTAEDIRVDLNWKELVEDGSSVFTFTSGGKVFLSKKGDHNVSVVMPAKNVMSTYFLVAKKQDLMLKEFFFGSTKFRVFSIGMNSKGFDGLTKRFKEIIKAQMESLEELEEQREYNIIFLEDNKRRISYYNDFSKTLTLYSNKNTKVMKHLIGHEFLHRIFIRNRLNFAKDVAPHDPDSFWFIEGFNDYLTRDINLKHSIISEEEYVSNLNEVIKVYLDRQIFYSCKKYDSALATLHGDLLAMQIDSKLKIKTNGKYNLVYLIRDLIKENAGTNISLKDIDNFILKRSGEKINISSLIERSLNKCIKDVGLKMPDYILGHRFKLKKEFGNKGVLRYIKNS
jgi:hypothetical protein